MSLRRDVHNAFEVIAPPLGGMPERVVQTVLADKRRRRKSAMLFRLRAPLSLVAALIAIALVAAVLVGGRIVQDWSIFRGGNPAGHTQPTLLKQLEARPLQIPIPKTPSDCQAGPFNVNGEFGTGPVYDAVTGLSPSDWGLYYHNNLYADTGIKGPILVRAVDLFTGVRVAFVGPYAAGDVVGHDTVDGAQVERRTELVVYTGSAKGLLGHKYGWSFKAGVPNSWSGDTGWQIDGASFTEIFLGC